MKEEDNILRKAGVKNPFKVPEGYFESLTSEVMNRLPQKEPVECKRPTLWQKVKPWVYMAAMFAGAALIIRIAPGVQKSNSEAVAVDDSEKEMEYINVVVDNSMLDDDYSLYVYLTDDDAE